MRLSGFHMPRWWQNLWRARYPMGPDNHLVVWVKYGRAWPRQYTIAPMPCGCGYRVHDTHYRFEQIGSHYPTLGAAIRKARKHARRLEVEYGR